MRFRGADESLNSLYQGFQRQREYSEGIMRSMLRDSHEVESSSKNAGGLQSLTRERVEEIGGGTTEGGGTVTSLKSIEEQAAGGETYAPIVDVNHVDARLKLEELVAGLPSSEDSEVYRVFMTWKKAVLYFVRSIGGKQMCLPSARNERRFLESVVRARNLIRRDTNAMGKYDIDFYELQLQVVGPGNVNVVRQFFYEHFGGNWAEEMRDPLNFVLYHQRFAQYMFSARQDVDYFRSGILKEVEQNQKPVWDELQQHQQQQAEKSKKKMGAPLTDDTFKQLVDVTQRIEIDEEKIHEWSARNAAGSQMIATGATTRRHDELEEFQQFVVSYTVRKTVRAGPERLV